MEQENPHHSNKKYLLFAVVTGLILGVGVLFYLIIKDPPINSFAQCVRAGNPVQESYPEVCRTKNGKNFTNPNQLNFLDIKEWGIRLSIANRADGVRYLLSDNRITLSSLELDNFVAENKQCAVATQQVVITRSKSTLKDSKQVGEYYYYSPKSKVAPCIGTDITKIKKLNDQAYELQWRLPSYKDVELIPNIT